MVLVTLPLFAGVLFAWWVARVDQRFSLVSQVPSAGEYVIGFLWRFAVEFGPAMCVQFVQVQVQVRVSRGQQLAGQDGT